MPDEPAARIRYREPGEPAPRPVGPAQLLQYLASDPAVVQSAAEESLRADDGKHGNGARVAWWLLTRAGVRLSLTFDAGVVAAALLLQGAQAVPADGDWRPGDLYVTLAPCGHPAQLGVVVKRSMSGGGADSARFRGVDDEGTRTVDASAAAYFLRLHCQTCGAAGQGR